VDTRRLVLLRPAPADAEEIFHGYANDPEVTRYLGWPRHESLAHTRAFVAFSEAEWSRWPAGPYLIRSRETHLVLGTTGLSFERAGEAMTGYVLATDAWGHGYATEALTAMIEVARAVGVVRLYSLCHPSHRASWHVLEKCGFTRDQRWTRPIEFPNLARGILQPVLCYARDLALADVAAPPDRDEPHEAGADAPGEHGPARDERGRRLMTARPDPSGRGNDDQQT
jgi:RimJ/RimL family protein N-acetyltransferase